VTPAARLARVLFASLAFLTVGAAADSAAAAAACPSPWQGTATCHPAVTSYGNAAATASVTVPAGVTSISIEMSGGAGGGGNGGCAGVIEGVLPTIAGQQLTVIGGGEGGWPKNSAPSQYGGVGGGGGGGPAELIPTQVSTRPKAGSVSGVAADRSCSGPKG
jgi:hypothetical protein